MITSPRPSSIALAWTGTSAQAMEGRDEDGEHRATITRLPPFEPSWHLTVDERDHGTFQRLSDAKQAASRACCIPWGS